MTYFDQSRHHGGMTGYQQSILNDLGARRGAEDRPRIPVRARIIWDTEGEEWLDGEAGRLDHRDGAIFVYLHDTRCATQGAWLGPDDVWWDGKE